MKSKSKLNMDNILEDMIASENNPERAELFQIGKKISEGKQITEQELDVHTKHMLELFAFPFLQRSDDISIGALVGTAIAAAIAIAKICEKRTEVPYYTSLGKAIALHASYDVEHTAEEKLNG